MYYLQPYSREGREKELAVAALLDLAGAPVEQLQQPTSMEDLHLVGTQFRGTGRELVLRRDKDFRVQQLLGRQSCALEGFQARARAASSSSEPMSEVLKATKYEGKARAHFQFVSVQDFMNLLQQAQQFPPTLIGMPLSFSPGFPGFHVPGCSCQNH